MSRRSRRGPRSTAFTVGATADIQKALTGLYQSMQGTLVQPMLTHGELLAMFAPPEDQIILEQAPKIGAVSHYYAENSMSFTFPAHGVAPESPMPLGIMFFLNGDRKDLPLLPKVPTLQPGFYPRADEIKAWARARVELAFDWGLVRRYFDVLNRACGKPAQIRYLWPALVGVLRTCSDLQEALTRLEEFKRPSELPNFSQEFVEVGRRCTQIVATALIMKDVLPDAVPEPAVRLGISMTGLKRLSHCKEIDTFVPANE
jgi:hypothetical protein